MNGPNEVVLTSRQVIEGKLLAALGEPGQVAILATKDDIDVLIAGLHALTTRAGVDPVRARSLAEGLMQLRREAFP